MTSSATLAPGEIRTHRSGDVKLVMLHVGTGHIQIQHRVNGDLAGCWTETHETDALRIWAALIERYPAEVSTVQLGTVAITVTVELVAGVHRVETVQGQVRDEWTRPYGKAHEAHEAFTRTCAAFRAHGTAEAIERQRNELAVELSQQEARRRRGMHNQTRINAIVRELNGLADLNDHYAAFAAA